MQQVLVAVKNFTNPFGITDKDRLYSLASGAPMPGDVEIDVQNAEVQGHAAKDQLLARLQSDAKGKFFEPIKKKKLKTMEAANKKVLLTSTQGKVL